VKHSFQARTQEAQQQRAAWYFGNLREAERALQAGNYVHAEQILTRLVSARPDDHHARRLLDIARARQTGPQRHGGPPSSAYPTRPPRTAPSNQSPYPRVSSKPRRSPTKVVGLVVSALALIVASLQLAHDTLGLAFSPIGTARDIVTPILDGDTDGGPVDGLPDPGAPDGSPPTAPSNLRVQSQEGCNVDLAWDPSTDDVAVQRYRLYDNGNLSGGTDGAITTQRVPLISDGEHRFVVVASDGLNDSPPSNELTVAPCNSVP
jgi:hypothetical protein